MKITNALGIEIVSDIWLYNYEIYFTRNTAYCRYILEIFSFGKNWLHSKLFVKLVYAFCLGSGYQKLKTTFSHFDHSRCCSVFFDIINTANIKFFECNIRIILTGLFIRGMNEIISNMGIICYRITRR